MTGYMEKHPKFGYLCEVVFFTGDSLGYVIIYVAAVNVLCVNVFLGCTMMFHIGIVVYRNAFITQDDINGGRKKWVQAIQLSLNTTRPQCSRLSDKDITDYFMMKIDEFSATNRDQNARCKIAAQVTGLQKPAKTTQDARKIWVLNEQVQFDADGVQCHDSPYIWLGDICQKRKDLFLPDKHGDYAIADPRKKSLASPMFSAAPLSQLLDALEANYGTNFPGALLVLGGYILAIHYESLIDIYNKVPATLVYGEVQCGNSAITRAALSTMGVQQANFFSSMSDVKTFAFSSQTTLGMVLDDPCDLKQVSNKLTHHFQKSVAATMSYEYSPRTTFISSMNEPTLKGLAKHLR